MEFKDFKKVIDELGDYAISILFTSWGEPLLNKEFPKMVKYAKKNKHVPFVSVVTNLNATLSGQDIEDLINSGLDLMCIAIDGATQEVYEKYRRGGSLEKLINNTKRLLRKREELEMNRPFIVWQFLVFRHNEHEIEAMRTLAKSTGVDSLRISAPQVYIDCADKPFKEAYDISKEHLPPLGSKYSFYNSDGSSKKPVSRCQWLWKSVMVNSNGGVSACCGTFPEKYDFGNILNGKNFKTIWNNEKYQNARKAVKDPNYAKKLFGEGSNLVCALCTVYGNWF